MQSFLLFSLALFAAGIFIVTPIMVRRSSAKKAKKIALQLGLPDFSPEILEVPPLPSDEELLVSGPPSIDDAPLVAAAIEPELRIGPPRLRDRLARSAAIFSPLRSRSGEISDELFSEYEDALLSADVGVVTSQRILDSVKLRVKSENMKLASEALNALKLEIRGQLEGEDRSLATKDGEPNVWMFVGVNGVGKTTTIAKLAQLRQNLGSHVILAAADTFRAAAADQLAEWASRTGAEIVRGQEGADPGSVVYDAMNAAVSRNADLVIIDTAGRLHTKSNLMDELKKLKRIVDKTEGALKEVLLVIDATTGQNGLAQAKEFASAVDVTGVVLTKLDGSSKGGVVVAIESELGVPVKVVGVGEAVGDLIPFDPVDFVEALFAV